MGVTFYFVEHRTLTLVVTQKDLGVTQSFLRGVGLGVGMGVRAADCQADKGQQAATSAEQSRYYTETAEAGQAVKPDSKSRG